MDIYDIKKDLNLNTVQFENTNLILKSKDISELLRDCDKKIWKPVTPSISFWTRIHITK